MDRNYSKGLHVTPDASLKDQFGNFVKIEVFWNSWG